MNSKRLYKTSLLEKPLDHIVSDGGYTSIFKKICVIGDSLSSGEIEYYSREDKSRHCFDTFDYSWGTFIGKMTGSEISHISFGGASAKCLLAAAKERGFFTEKDKTDCYIIALGYNDMFGYKQQVGSLEDIENSESNTVAYYYYQVIKKALELNKNARLFFVTMPKSLYMSKEAQVQIKLLRELLYSFTTIVKNSYVIDLWKYGPKHDKKFKEKFYLESHLNFEGYYMTAKQITSYIDYIIRKDRKSFFDQDYYEEKMKNYKDILG